MIAPSARTTSRGDAVVLGAPARRRRVRARSLYRWLRDADAQRLDVVLAVAPPNPSGIGAAVADRLRRCRRGRHDDADDAPIGVFDSGLGGLTVLRALIDLLPDEPIVYFGDTGRFPYGPKPADEVLAVRARDHRRARSTAA